MLSNYTFTTEELKSTYFESDAKVQLCPFCVAMQTDRFVVVALLQYFYFRRQHGPPLLSIIRDLRQLPYFIMGKVGITVNLLIDQNIILYLLLHEMILSGR